MRKILFTDLDGTLLRDDTTVSEGNRAAIRQMLDAGHHLVVATGRPVSSGLTVVKKLGLTLPGCYMIAFNGSVIYDCSADCILQEHTMPIEYVEYLFEEANRSNIHIQTYSDSQVLAQQWDEELDYYQKTTGMSAKIVRNIFDALDKEPCKVLLASLSGQERLKKFQREHRSWETGRCSSFFSSREYLEYCPEGINKGLGVSFLREFLNVKRENTYAVGDERNDIPMLREAGTGIAVRNAYEEVKMAADYVTEHDNERDAIVEIIDKFILM